MLCCIRIKPALVRSRCVFSISCSLHGTRSPSPIGSIPYSEEKVKIKLGIERIKPPPELDIESPNLADE